MMDRRSFARLLVALPASQAILAEALEVRFQHVAERVHVHVADIGPRSAANEGLNANPGLVVTPQGAVLIDSGATFRSARDIHAAVRRVTKKPVRRVVNTGASPTSPRRTTAPALAWRPCGHT
jgi:hypothetical protein